ncbi:hypothetical protein PghCCS26_47180 [Paenibacillus glycanilyticus]|uniref:Uncharacterized protein n=1 Tax=Paenibacillus glycanilyticus TaxID=126569 RepID=A0ABQ6NSP7_9BACL|nr:hypothetical protein [Paenibacillus glycanilyticus]GMK47588.1 hypothetical protein PghCCS26_47180 [Paenibacillus glycanilyticus]
MDDTFTQRMLEIAQQSEAYYTARIAELTAEVRRLRTNMTELQTYAETKAAEYSAKEDNGVVMTLYYCGKADAYADMAARASVAYIRPNTL